MDMPVAYPYMLTTATKSHILGEAFRQAFRVVAQGLAHLVRDQGVGGSNPLCPIFLYPLAFSCRLRLRAYVGVVGRSMAHEGGLRRIRTHQDCKKTRICGQSVEVVASVTSVAGVASVALVRTMPHPLCTFVPLSLGPLLFLEIGYGFLEHLLHLGGAGV